MANIPSGTKFLGLPSSYPTQEKKSKRVNDNSEYYTIDDIAAAALPSYVETDDTDKTIWCNGTGDIGSNTVFGESSLIGNSTGEYNTAIGANSMEFNSTGVNNTALGYDSLTSNLAGGFNTAIGSGSLSANTSGLNNTAIGATSLFSNSAGEGNTAIGQSSLEELTSGSYNTAVGAQTGGFLNTTGSYNSLFGYRATNAGFNECVVLGFDAAATGDNQFVVGSATANAGSVEAEVNTSTQVWNVKINGVDYKILLA
jgi:hypothetical protein